MNRLVIFVLVCLLLVAGCLSAGRKIDQESVDRIKQGETTKAQVLEWLGSPDRIIRDGRGNETFSYHYVRSTTKPQTFIPIIGPFVGGANVQSQFVSVRFGPNGVVNHLLTSHGATETDQNLNTGSKPEVSDVEDNKRPK